MDSVRDELIGILRVPIFPHELVDPAEAVADYLLDNGVTIMRWIPVTERVPEDGASVLVAAHNGRVVLGSLYRNPFSSTGYAVSNGCAAYSNASHWMPLPEPPKEVAG